MTSPLQQFDRDRALNDLAAAEKRHCLFDYRVDGWSAWRVVRHSVQRATACYGLARPTQHDGLRIIWAVGATLQLLLILAFPRRVGLLVKTQRSALRTGEGGRYRDIYFDGLLLPSDRHFKLEVIDSRDFDEQARAALFPSHLNAVVFTFWGRLLGKLMPADAADFAKRASTILREEVGVEMGPSTILMLVSTAYWQSRLFGLLLRRLRPDLALVCDTGEYGLVIACRKVGVPIIELQHGVFDASHPDAVPDWVAGSESELVLPNVLATRNQFWINQLLGTHQAAIAVPVGNEMLDQALERRAAHRAVARDQALPRRVVVTTQGMDTERLAAWVGGMVESAPADQDWRLTIKLHPVYDAATTAFDRLAEQHPNVTVVAGTGRPNVFDLLIEADLHLSIASACLFEAAALGVPSLVIPLSGHQDVLPHLDGSMLRLATTPSDAWVPRGPVLESDVGIYSRPGFKMNMRALIDQMKARR